MRCRSSFIMGMQCIVGMHCPPPDEHKLKIVQRYAYILNVKKKRFKNFVVDYSPKIILRCVGFLGSRQSFK